MPEGVGIAGAGAVEGLVLEEGRGLVVVGVVSFMLRQPAKRVAVNTKIKDMIHAFFMIYPPVFLSTCLVFLSRTVLHPEISYKIFR